MPPGLALIAQHGAAAQSANSTKSDSKSTFSRATQSSSSSDSGITIDVALKVIPKKKVKGNESSVWGEMEVLKGLDHPNIVRHVIFVSVV